MGRIIDPGPRLPTMQIVNAQGAAITVNAAPTYEGDEDDKKAVRAHASALAEHARMLAEWAKMGYAPADVVEPTQAQVEAAPVAKRGRK